ncbi:electron transfer flavoprotein subunit alpha/FixB family protein [bacterium]|nr:electron transfer flavoprotein subunit alpha/FixB family protein [bacterium]
MSNISGTSPQPSPTSGEGVKNVLIYAEVTPDNYVHTVTFELANKALELAGKFDNAQISALLICKNGLAEKYKEAFINSGFDKVYVAENDRFTHYSTELFAKTAIDILNEVKPDIFLIGATIQGRDLAPRISTSLHTGLTADCTRLDINEKGQLAATRPTFGGQLMATILCKKLPQMATVRPKVFKPLPQNVVKNTEFIYFEPKINDIRRKVEFVEFEKYIQSSINELDSAEIIVAGGKGMKNEAGFLLLKKLASVLKGTVGASRGAVEIGLAPQDIQIGQTGKTVSPKLYIACGISGAIQHLVGIEGANRIIAVNTDPNAPIFDNCDCGIVGDAFEVIPKLTEKFK